LSTSLNIVFKCIYTVVLDLLCVKFYDGHDEDVRSETFAVLVL